MKRYDALGEFEQSVLLAIAHLGAERLRRDCPP